jgi:fibro-slime domain-containing protein
MTKNSLSNDVGRISLKSNLVLALSIAAAVALIAACEGGTISPEGNGGASGGGQGGNGSGNQGGDQGGASGGPVTLTIPPVTPPDPDAAIVLPGGGTCGDGIQQRGETCDDGNTDDNDCCNRACQLEANCECPEPGKPCVSLAVCGNGLLTSDETCDDGNETSGDGCSADCNTVEDGWVCPVPGRKCIPDCGDAKMTADELCDDGNTNDGDGCSSTCQVEPGYDCPTLGEPCIKSVCGNGKREVGETCDCGTDEDNLPDGCKAVNGLFYGDPENPGCSKTCTSEPKCLDDKGKTQACSSSCGDGNIDPGEDCDDGNANSGDGCSEECKFEEGFTCTTTTQQDSEDCQETSGQCLRLPVIYRDFKPQSESGGHPDFYWLSKTQWCVPNSGGPSKGNDSTTRCWGIVANDLSYGKPQPGNTKSCSCQFSDWSIGNSGDHIGGNYHDTDSPLNGRSDVTAYTSNGGPIWNGTMPSYKDADSLKQWFNDDDSVNETFLDILELPSIGSNIYQYASKQRKLDGGFFPLDQLNADQRTLCNMWPYWNSKFFPNCTGDQYLFPPRIQSSDCPTGDDYLDGCWLTGLTGVKHDSYFTDEVRYYFVYDGSAGISLQFFGDDDLFIFINGKLVLDLGSVHQQLPGKVTVSGSPGTATIVEGGCLDTAGNIIGAEEGSDACSPTNSSPPTAREGDDFHRRTVNLGLENGRVYEIAIFGADRHPPESNYQLTLQGFTTKKSSCQPRCGDGRVTAGEQCDCGDGSVDVPSDCPGKNDDNLYGGCTTKCKYGPFCGDGKVQTENGGNEECDNGKQNGADLSKDGCTIGCMKPHFCGDGITDTDLGEECDFGENNGKKLDKEGNPSDAEDAFIHCLEDCSFPPGIVF